MYRPLCMCALIPRLETRTRLLVVMHYREVAKTTNTGGLACRMLANSYLKIRGDGSPAPGVPEGHRPLLLYPGPGSVELTESLANADARPLCLIVPDGTWRQARKVRTREGAFRGLPCVRLPAGGESEYRLRKVSRPGNLCTFEAIARALGILESPALRERMEAVFRIRVERILWSKGRLDPREATGGIPEEAYAAAHRAGLRDGAPLSSAGGSRAARGSS